MATLSEIMRESAQAEDDLKAALIAFDLADAHYMATGLRAEELRERVRCALPAKSTPSAQRNHQPEQKPPVPAQEPRPEPAPPRVDPVPPPAPESPSVAVKPPKFYPNGASNRILNMLNTEPDRIFLPDEVAELMGGGYTLKQAGCTLSKLFCDNRIYRVQQGMYCALRGSQAGREAATPQPPLRKSKDPSVASNIRRFYSHSTAQRVLSLLNAEPDRIFTTTEVIKFLGNQTKKQTASVLSYLFLRGQAEFVQTQMYRSVQGAKQRTDPAN